MKVRADCAPCLINRALSALDKSGISEEAKFRAMTFLIQSLASRYNEEAVPAFLEKDDMDFIKEFTGCNDPYAEVKSKAYLIAKKVAEKVVVDYGTWSEKNLRHLMELAVAANGLEFDVKGYEFDPSSLERPMPLAIDDIHYLWAQAASSKVIAYVLDNVGEHVFDLMAAKYLSTHIEVHVYAKSTPLLNDVTRDELSRDLLPPLRAHYYEPRAVGITWDDFDDDYDFVIAKGMANYETLTEGKSMFPVYHALKVKCRPMALSLGAPLLSGVVKRRQ
ncbi:MAG: ARMT1-like domain-containing protein [Thermoprotei archaeon]|nr:ARMT1-like domain-containing protein [TACK group archaeon]